MTSQNELNNNGIEFNLIKKLVRQRKSLNFTDNNEEIERLDTTIMPEINFNNGNAGNISLSTEVGEGRYIKGDPLNGYYDFVITEGSFKFWAIFQLFTAALIIYSTFAAIYYSKVNPLTSDYDYLDYLGGGRSFESRGFSNADEVINDGNSYWSSLIHGNWLNSATYAFQFVLDAIEKIPQ